VVKIFFEPVTFDDQASEFYCQTKGYNYDPTLVTKTNERLVKAGRTVNDILGGAMFIVLRNGNCLYSVFTRKELFADTIRATESFLECDGSALDLGTEFFMCPKLAADIAYEAEKLSAFEVYQRIFGEGVMYFNNWTTCPTVFHINQE
jgi:hypothetical protein